MTISLFLSCAFFIANFLFACLNSFSFSEAILALIPLVRCLGAPKVRLHLLSLWLIDRMFLWCVNFWINGWITHVFCLMFSQFFSPGGPLVRWFSLFFPSIHISLHCVIWFSPIYCFIWFPLYIFLSMMWSVKVVLCGMDKRVVRLFFVVWMGWWSGCFVRVITASSWPRWWP
jgi:hypothetical protein